MLKINNNIVINSNELKYRSIKSSEPGGQNFNKNSTTVSIQLDIAKSKSLSDEEKNKLLYKSNKYITKSGKINIKVHRYKSQKRN